MSGNSPSIETKTEDGIFKLYDVACRPVAYMMRGTLSQKFDFFIH